VKQFTDSTGFLRERKAMVKVTTTTSYIDVEVDHGSVEGVEVTCDKCGHSEESGGTHEGSLNRCAYLLRENCPNGEKNFYVITE
jgi:hypothetical protein